MKYKFDGSLDGIFSCILRCFINKENPNELICDPVQLSLTDQIVEVETDFNNNKRVINAFYKYCGSSALRDLKYAFRSGDKNKNTIIFNFIKKTFDCRKNISDKFSDPVVMQYFDLIKRISLEAHRSKGFLRFSESEKGVLYARFEPDNDVADLLVSHFSNRFKDIPFAIHDLKRNKLIMHANGKTQTIIPNFPIAIVLGKHEENFDNLWKTYYDSVTITERINPKLMYSFMPARYHKHMNEKRLKIS